MTNETHGSPLTLGQDPLSESLIATIRVPEISKPASDWLLKEIHRVHDEYYALYYVDIDKEISDLLSDVDILSATLDKLLADSPNLNNEQQARKAIEIHGKLDACYHKLKKLGNQSPELRDKPEFKVLKNKIATVVDRLLREVFKIEDATTFVQENMP